jgi:hypothetical protein
MDTTLRVQELIDYIYDENLNHFEFHENMGGEDCDCHLHTTLETIVSYWEKLC